MWHPWHPDPVVNAEALGALALYFWLYRRSLDDRGRARWPVGRALAFAAGVLVVVLALESPLDELADVLFFAHMLQHMLLLVVAPPVLLLGLPAKAMLRALPARFRRGVVRPAARSRVAHRVGSFLVAPATVFVYFNAALALWHVPGIFATALTMPLLHVAEHASFLTAGCLLWWVIVEPLRVWPKDADLPKIAFVVVCHLPMLLLGQLFLAFTSVTPYVVASDTTRMLWGLTALSDQRIGGAIMFGLDMAVTFVTVSVLFGRYLVRLERRQLVLDEALAAGTSSRGSNLR